MCNPWDSDGTGGFADIDATVAEVVAEAASRTQLSRAGKDR
jgi:hypothetical protein